MKGQLKCHLFQYGVAFALLIASIPYAFAQTGWVPVHRDGTDGSYSSDYDLTGLACTTETKGADGTLYTYQDTAYGERGWAVGPGRVIQNTFTLSGNAQFKWIWTPPNNDFDRFSAPSLYVLNHFVIGQAYLSGYNQDGTMRGIAGSGSTSDGWGWSNSFNTLPGQLPNNSADMPRRHVSLATYDDATKAATTTISPSLYLGIFGSDPGDQGIGHTYSFWYPSPILLSSPDPFGRPDLGDGTNQYVYTADTPDGYLYVPGMVTVAGGVQADAQWLLDNGHIDMKVENSTIPGTFAHGWAVSGSTISVNTTNNNYPGYQPNTWVFKGLPSNNTGFGNHEVNLYVDGGESQTAHIQTFFNPTASNYPYATVPNWYYYYYQVYPDPDAFYADIPTSNTNARTFATLIGNDAYSNTYFHLYMLPAGAKFIKDGGQLDANGIHNFIFTCAHEATHRQYLSAGIDNPYRPRHVNTNAITPDQDPDGDWDGDGLSNGWEIAHNLDPLCCDTAGDYSGASVGDSELYANIGGWGVLSGKKIAWKQDWASNGLQWRDWFTYDPAVNPVAKHSYRPWQYASPAPTYFASDPPNSVLTAMP